MIRSFASGATASLVTKNRTRKTYHLSEFKLTTPKPITRTYFETNLSRFGLAGLPISYLGFLDIHVLTV